VLSLAGITPAQAGCKDLDGVDMNPVLSGRAQSPPDRDLYFYYGQDGPDTEMVSVIAGRWKLTVTGPDIRHGLTGKNHLSLYDIRNDPNETQDVAADHSDLVHKLVRQLIEFRDLQIPNAIPPYGVRVEGFVPPKEWKIETP
jgi:arylsulfatase A-like enzyme